ncbi:MAG: alpha/beta hydrolase [Clostridia bacterium]|nr:alpha/beta hydrolase [Clostridia bacterium]
MADPRFNADGLVLSAGYAETMNEAALPYINARRRNDQIPGDGGRPLFVSRFDAENPVGTVLIVHGFTENADKFSELIHSLLRGGYSVVAYDQRGHGRSWRAPGLAEASVTHVDDFDEYVRDLEIVVEKALRTMPKPWFLFAHSMGGAVSSLYLERYSGIFQRAALCAPMIEPNLGGLPVPAARLLCGGAGLLGRRGKRIFASKPYAGPEDFATSAASGKERFDWYDAVKANTALFQNNGPTYGWTQQALRANRMLLAPGAVEKIETPVRVYTAENDGSVMPEAQRVFVARLKDGQRVLVKGAKHEIYRSPDGVLFPWWHEILEYYRGKVNNDGSNG